MTNGKPAILIRSIFSSSRVPALHVVALITLSLVSSVVNADSAGISTTEDSQLRATARSVDSTPPTIAGSLRSVRYSSTAGEIIWTAATDDTLVVGYRVLRDGESLGIRDARSLYEPVLEPGRSYTYRISALDRAGNEGPVMEVILSGNRGETLDGRVPGEGDSPDESVEPDEPVEPDPDPDNEGTDDGGLILYRSRNRVTLAEGDSSGISIELSVQRTGADRRPVSLSLTSASGREFDQLRATFSTTTLARNESGSVLTLRLDVGVAPLIPHERYFNIVADDGVSRTSEELIIDVTPTSAPDVYLLIGQSNMEGYSEVGSRQRYPGGLDERNPRIQQLNVQPNSFSVFTNESLFTDEGANIRQPAFVPAEDPLHEPRYIEVDGKGATFVGLGLTFAKQALRTTEADIYLVPAAWGATGFCANANGNLAWNAAAGEQEFLGGTLLTNRALTRLNMTLRETGGVLRGILWHQGGADSNNPDCARTYQQNLINLVNRLRSDARVDARGAGARGSDAIIPFIVATQSRGDDERARFSIFNPFKQQVDAAHRTVASFIDHADFVNNDDLVPPQYPCGQVSCVHFGAAALREQGRRFYAALTRIWADAGAYHH